jgi:type I restriction enzyme S subunit
MRPYVRAANITWEGLDLSDVKQMNFTEAESAVYELLAGDVLVAEASGSASEVGKAAMWRGEIEGCCFQNTIIRVRSHGVAPEYLRYFLFAEARSGRIGNASPGVGIHHIGSRRLAQWPVAVPPLNEQRRIVAAIEEHLSRLDAADASLAAALRRLVGLRRASLNASFPIGVRTVPLGELAGLIRGVTYKKQQARADAAAGFSPILRATNIGEGLNFDGLVYVPDAVIRDEQRLRVGDVVVAASSGSASVVGKSAMLNQSWEGSFGAFCAVLRARDVIEPSYLAAFVSSPMVRQRWSELAAGTNINNLKREHITDTPVPLPSVEEQRRIVQEVEERLSRIDAMRASIERAQKRSKALRAAILERAFRGELVPQDPSDEPAEALLARIRAVT